MRKQRDIINKLIDFKKAGFKLEWLASLHGNKVGIPSRGCGLTGCASTSAMKHLMNGGAIRRGKIQKTHTRIWLPGAEYDKWLECIPVAAKA